ncbi:MAG: hypothetical protein RIS94_898 [Pseudomonadota bacterium]|jgi:hypothetical protein
MEIGLPARMTDYLSPIALEAAIDGAPARHDLADVTETMRGMVDDLRTLLADIACPSAAAQGAGAGRAAIASAELVLGTARRLYRDRRQRADVFKATLFSEPAWDMLLDLFIAGREGRQVSITSACIGADVPVATGLRWLQQLEREGLVERSSDPCDARRTWIRLTAQADRSMIRYLNRSMAPLAEPARAVPRAVA